jgi:hypothetical protein
MANADGLAALVSSTATPTPVMAARLLSIPIQRTVECAAMVVLAEHAQTTCANQSLWPMGKMGRLLSLSIRQQFIGLPAMMGP